MLTLKMENSNRHSILSYDFYSQKIGEGKQRLNIYIYNSFVCVSDISFNRRVVYHVERYIKELC